ncbi:SH3 domain-containing protein [Hyphomicrobium nitrativorans]|uniref:SH3 domain-containing protein n=1 Tax=Hyphomicrobium nitrativorans TaxID=1427356 RepID=UPI0006867E1D|nr:SH3 domain-containing protein [Hyphomicrobium nitrativorans]
MLRPFLILSVVSGATAAFAGPVPLSGDDLKRSFNGALVEMDTPLGTTIPVRFGTDGLVSGEAGELAPLLGSARDRGRWWIDGDRICSKWFRWFDAEPQCLSVQQDGARLFWQQDNGKKGTATLVEGPPAEKAAPQATVVASADSVPHPTSPSAKAKSQTKGDAARARAPAPRTQSAADPLPLPVRAPQRVTEPRGVAGVDLAPEGEAHRMPQDRAAVVQTATAPEAMPDVPMMRFGGAGLLAASARIAGEEASQPARVPVTPVEAEKQKPAAEIRVAARAAPEPTAKPVVASQPARAETGSLKQPAAKITRAGREPWTSAPSIHAPGHYRVRGVARSDVLNVRRGPSDGHPAVASIPPNGRRIEITGACQGEWCPVRYRRATGWVHGFYLSEEAPGRGSASRVYLAQP